ncbi:MAG TPA: RNA polymerase sigma factor [Bacteroidia bacterium]|nr:RNA polymerase sigma factor [Bacteroidia bacterium]
MIEIPDIIKIKTSAALNGDATAMGALFEWYRPRLHAHALRICGNTPLAQDAVQDTFIAAFTHLYSLRDAQLFYPWLKKILVNNCYQLLRKERSVEFTDSHLANDALLHRSIDEHFENISNSQRMYEALRFLSDELRSCVMLRYFSSVKSYEEIALVLGIPVGTVRSRLAAAREKLSEHFIGKDDADDAALKEAQQWSGFYSDRWNKVYDDQQARKEFFNHLIPALNIRFTSGKFGTGRNILEEEINNDLFYGSRFAANDIVSSGNITVMEGPNFNHPDYPDRCAPATALILFRKNDKVEVTHIFDSPRP